MRSLALVLLVALPAAAQEPAGTLVRRGHTVDGKNEISTQLGYQASLGATTPAGLRLDIDYARKLSDLVWLDLKVDPLFAVGPNRAVCIDNSGAMYDCGSAVYGDGYAFDVLGGIKLKFPVPRVPNLVPYAQLDAGVTAIFARPQNDDGAGLIFRTGGGVRYFVTPHVGLGGELNLTLGPAWYSQTCNGCNNAHTELYRAIDFAIGAEFVL